MSVFMGAYGTLWWKMYRLVNNPQRSHSNMSTHPTFFPKSYLLSATSQPKPWKIAWCNQEGIYLEFEDYVDSDATFFSLGGRSLSQRHEMSEPWLQHHQVNQERQGWKQVVGLDELVELEFFWWRWARWKILSPEPLEFPKRNRSFCLGIKKNWHWVSDVLGSQLERQS